MNKKSASGLVTGVWGRVIIFSLILFFISLGDAVLSDWVPSFIQNSLGSPLLMGLIMSFSSIVGFGADLVLPQVLRRVKTKKLILLSVGTSLMFAGVMLWSVAAPVVLLFLFGMAVWGIYYEFLGFGNQQYVSGSVPSHQRSAVWAIIGVFRSLAYFVGPIIGSSIALTRGNYSTVLFSAGAILFAYMVFLFLWKGGGEVELEGEVEKINIWSELKKWKLLFVHVWPVMVISLMLGLIDATYWTTGTVLTDSLAVNNWWGSMFLPFYMLPSVFVGFAVAKWGIYKGKKKMAEVFLLLSGLVLSLMSFGPSLTLMLLVAFFSGVTLSVAWPLTEAVYSDIIDRMGGEGKHMMGLSSSTISLAYVFGPVMAGGIAQVFGEQRTFAIVGGLTVLISLILLRVTPKKLRLPQEEIETWD